LRNTRIYYILNDFPLGKAHTVQILKTSDSLKSFGYDIKLLVPKQKKDLDTEQIQKKFSLKNKLTIVLLSPISVRKRNVVFRRAILWALKIIFSLSCSFYILKDDFPGKKMIYTRNWKLALMSFILSKIIHGSIIFELHNIPNQKYVKLFSFLFNKLTIVTVSKYLKELLVQLGLSGEKIHCLPNGFDDQLFNASKKQIDSTISDKLSKLNGKIVMYVGTLDEWKNVEFVLESSNYTKNNVSFVFVGGTPKDIGRLESKSKSKNCIFYGRVSYRQLPQFMQRADILVVSPSNLGKNMVSFSPLKLFEYMGMQKPILAPNFPWISEIITDGENGILYNTNSTKDLAQKVDTILDNPVLKKKLSEKASSSALNFTISKRTKKLISLIKKYIENFNAVFYCWIISRF